MSASPTFSKFIPWLLIAVLALGYLGHRALTKPAYNWDLIGYMSAVLKMDRYTDQKNHKHVYETLYKELPRPAFNKIIGVDKKTGSKVVESYRYQIYQDPEALQQQLPFYQIRVAYTALYYGLYKLGVPLSKAPSILSWIFASICCLIGLSLIPMSKVAWLVYLVVFFEVIKASWLVRLATPDLLAAAWVLFAMTSYLKGRKTIALILTALLPFFRTDFIILSGLMLTTHLSIVVKNKHSKSNAPWIAGLGLLSLIVYSGLNSYFGNYGYLTIFNFTLIQNTPYPAFLDVSLQANDYINAYLNGLGRWTHSRVGWFFIFCTLGLLSPISRKLSQELRLLSIVSLAFVAIHFALFPAFLERHYFFASIWLSITLAWWTHTAMPTSQQTEAASSD